jgi:alanine dehydrogenase
LIIGVPKEIKPDEDRVAITPAGVHALAKEGHKLLIETGAGLGSGISDEDFVAAGADMMDSVSEIFTWADILLKVKEPLPSEYAKLREGQVLFTYLHLARGPELTSVLVEKKVIAIAYETIQLDNGTLPLLIPMSEVAGKMAVQIGAHFLEKPSGGRGILLGGVPGVPAAEVVIAGAGTVGTNAIKIAVGMGAQVTVIDRSDDRLRYLDDLYGGRIKTVVSNHFNVETVDRDTTHSDPVFEKHGVLHYAVVNMPGAVARTSTFALTNATLPYVLELANKGYVKAILDNPAIARGVNVFKGNITCRAVGESLNKASCELSDVLK